MSNENTQPVHSLQRAIIELNLAYEATVEGFARALEPREGEPIGHTHQVTEITARLAKRSGWRRSPLHLRRGALLHEIGKLGIPKLRFDTAIVNVFLNAEIKRKVTRALIK